MWGQCTKSISRYSRAPQKESNALICNLLRNFPASVNLIVSLLIRLIHPCEPRCGSHPEISRLDCPQVQVTHACHILERPLTQFEIAQ